jgi:hypothetical protein
MIRKEYKKLALTSSQDKVFFKIFVVTFADRYCLSVVFFCWSCTFADRYFCWSLILRIVTFAFTIGGGGEGGNLIFCMKCLAVAAFLTVHLSIF